MPSLIHNTVKTARGDYSFNTREEAEAFFIAVSLRERQRPAAAPPPASAAATARRGRAARTPRH